MKKVLLATTALVASAGFAAADVSISGDGRMGLKYVDGAGSNNDGSSDEINFTSRVRVKFSLSGETDGGLAFGGSIRADNASGGSDGTAGSVFMSGAFGKLSMGDVGGAAEAAVGNLDMISLTGLSDYNNQFYLMQGDDPDGDGNDDLGYSNPSALYEYSSGDFAVYVGIGNIGGTNLTNTTAVISLTGTTTAGTVITTGVVTATVAGLNANLGNQFSVGGSYSFGDFTIAAGYESMDTIANGTYTGPITTASGTVTGTTGVSVSADDSAWTIGGSYAIGDTTLKAVYGQGSVLNRDSEQYGLSVKSTFGATSVAAFWNHKSIDASAAGAVFATAATATDNYGIGASYDLGGGAAIKGGIVGGDSTTRADFGVSFSF